MPRVRIVHTTEYSYARPVRFTPHRLMLRPRDSHDLRLLDATLGLTPPDANVRWAHDVFANSICYVDWNGAESEHLRIVSTLDLEHFPAALPRGSLDRLAETYPFSYPAEEFPDLARLLERHHPDPDRRVDAWARRFLRRIGPTRTMDLLIAMTQAIKADFRYEARAAEGTNPPPDTLRTSSGACRDFALLMMEAVRSLGLAARFVSGYLYDEGLVDSARPMVGGGATHAWCSVYLPGAGWVEFDPTNGLVAGRNLIRVCVARTPEQAVPVAGGFIGRPDDFVGLDVDVEVTVGDPAASARQGALALAVPA
ncbi:MAG: transglutaminase family protein [Rhodospirillales bacterium]|nr:transglutaminase family protein [Rhodospirillales bacterium]MDE2200000.1 transglutaminase family protein [Rhodospirillales bacterium]